MASPNILTIITVNAKKTITYRTRFNSTRKQYAVIFTFSFFFFLEGGEEEWTRINNKKLFSEDKTSVSAGRLRGVIHPPPQWLLTCISNARKESPIEHVLSFFWPRDLTSLLLFRYESSHLLQPRFLIQTKVKYRITLARWLKFC